jgi:hypothetical protein
MDDRRVGIPKGQADANTRHTAGGSTWDWANNSGCVPILVVIRRRQDKLTILQPTWRRSFDQPHCF